MDKISSILKSSPRVMAVDMRESGPVRPGTPAFGRMESASAKIAGGAAEMNGEMGREVNPMETAKRANAVAVNLADWRNKDQKQAALAADLSNKFFSKPVVEEELENKEMGRELQMPALRQMTMSDRASTPTGFKTDEMNSMRSLANRSFDAGNEMSMLAQPEGLYPKGSFIDRTA